MDGCWLISHHLKFTQAGFTLAFQPWNSFVLRVFTPLWFLWLMWGQRSDQVKVVFEVSIVYPELFQDTFHLSGLLPCALGSPLTLNPSNLPSSLSQLWALFFCSYSPQKPFIQTMVLDLLFTQQMSPERLPSSVHCARPMKTIREWDVPLGALDMGKMGQLWQWSELSHQGIIRRPSVPVLEGQRGI